MQFWLQIKGWSSMTLVFEGEVLSLSRMAIPGAVAGGVGTWRWLQAGLYGLQKLALTTVPYVVF